MTVKCTPPINALFGCQKSYEKMCSVEWSNETILFKCFIINDLQFNIHKLQLFKSRGMFHDILLFFIFLGPI